MLHCVRYISSFFILSLTDYQSILAELQSPAALYSDPHFLEPELPVTPNPSLDHQQHHRYPEPDTPLLAESQTQPLPWSPEIEPGSREADSPPKSPPRPCELALYVPVFDLPDPLPSKVTKPHIALNDQLLLSEEEDKSFHEIKLSSRPKSNSFPTMCELDTDMAYSTSSPSLSSVSSITPSSPDRAQMGDGGVLMDAPNGIQAEVGVKGGKKEVIDVTEKVVEKAASESEDKNGLVEKWVEQELIKNVEIKCEIITKDRSKMVEINRLLLEQEEERDMLNKQHVPFQGENKGKACEVVELRHLQNLSEEQHSLIEISHEVEQGTMAESETVKEDTEETTKGQKPRLDGEEIVAEGGKMGTDGEIQFNEKGGFCRSERDICGISEDKTGENQNQAAGRLSPQAWVEALGELQPSDSGSNNEEEEEDRDNQITEEPLGPLLEDVSKEEGSEEKAADEETTDDTVQEVLYQVERAEKDVCSLSGWHSDSSSVNVEPPTPGRSVSSDLLDRRTG